MKLPPLPRSWSALTWQQLCDCWQVKLRYAGNADAARAAALLKLVGLGQNARSNQNTQSDSLTGETRYTLAAADGRRFTVTPRELSQMAKQALPWFDFPYGDMGDKEIVDENGKVVKERREPHPGYVNPVGEWRDALVMPVETVTIPVSHFPSWRKVHFVLPQVACNNLTWRQYRSLQGIVAQIFHEGVTEQQSWQLQAQFLAHALTPRSLALFDTNGGSIRFHLHWEYRYDADRADRLAKWWERQMSRSNRSNRSNLNILSNLRNRRALSAPVLYYICFQAYQTAMQFYEAVFPDLFGGSSRPDSLRTALTGESDTIVAIMDEGGFTEPQQVYDAHLPFILSILNRMAKKAKEIEKMNAKIKKK